MNDKRKQPEKPENTGVRINKYLASCGLCSRREADKMIEAGRVQVNGETVDQMGIKIQPNDLVLVDDKPVDNNQEQIYLLYNKPRGLLCSRKDDKGRPLIYEHLDIPAHVDGRASCRERVCLYV